MGKKIAYLVGGLVVLALALFTISSLHIGEYELAFDQKGQYVYKIKTSNGETWRAGSSGVWHPMKTEGAASLDSPLITQ